MYPYPTEEQLEYIKSFDIIKNDPADLIDLIYNLWSYPDYFILENELLELHTGGWSGNESIIHALQENFFWNFTWMKSERGGHYYFDLSGLTRYNKTK